MLPFLELLDSEEDKSKILTLYQGFERQLYWVANYMLNDDARAEDMVQETFLAMTKHLDAIEEEAYGVIRNYLEHYEGHMLFSEYIKEVGDTSCGKAWGYVVTVLQNKIYDYFRQEKKAKTVSIEEFLEKQFPNMETRMTENQFPNMETVMLENQKEKQLVELVATELAKLKYPYKEALCMKYYDGLKAAEIGIVMEKSEDNVRQILRRGRDMLKRNLERGGYYDI